MNPSICEFIAENEIIQIVPNFKQRQLHLIGGDFGPFEAGSPVEVPIWLAIHLKRQQKCTIIAPNWLVSEELKKLILTESEMAGFAPIPEYFFEIAHILIASAPENLENVEQLKTLVKDLQDKREAKMRASVIKFMEQFQTEKAELNTGKAFVHSNAQMTNLTRFEICHFRAALVEPSKELDRLFDILNSESMSAEENNY